ncbi:type VII toxin-antitoxin system MntA family adenylyltransferase antitoxin [Candidatus Thiodictyon syntrophicum]|jgi:predicted nucleotidyltransferase|uniref:DNA polymerase subunit beta n=1 Tax=Candidatus Thiodictyon syntrophicum TaxID=1166950 RepID=A0A2K8UE25_9GAMM|nr:nucleotidyltransferase domain-containing protein [Candidatus Thiodictyon syntrophicum]AUB83341.1 DNA polymerase subunit beta [Candidatus Thiodictyon syntrophicum]
MTGRPPVPDQVPTGSALLEPLRQALGRADGGLVCAYLFGSTARGEARVGSDLDLAVLFATDPPSTLAGLHLDLADDLSAATGRPVDLVVLNRAPVDLVHRVLRDGILILDRDPSARIRFEVRARNEYFDLLPHLRRYRRMQP